MTIVKAQYDGQTFVPCEPVDLAKGTLVEVMVPALPRALTPTEEQAWEETLRAIRASEPAFPTVEEAMRYTRKRP